MKLDLREVKRQTASFGVSDRATSPAEDEMRCCCNFLSLPARCPLLRASGVRRGFRRCQIADAEVFANVRFAPTAEVSYDAITIPDLDLLSAITAGDREIAPRIGFSLTSNSALPEE
jgi:hypothetical protein